MAFLGVWLDWRAHRRNAGLNLLEIPSALNAWAGGRLPREVAIRVAVVGTSGGTGYGSYEGTRSLIDQVTEWFAGPSKPEGDK